jgi:hypothetical protein
MAQWAGLVPDLARAPIPVGTICPKKPRFCREKILSDKRRGYRSGE